MSDTTSTGKSESYEYDLRIEKTLAIVKPEAVKFAPEIEDIIKKNGFDILVKRTVHLTPEQAAELYSEHFGQVYFPNLVVHMSSSPCIALCIAKPNAIAEWRKIMGPANLAEAQAYWPNSIRASYGIRGEDDYYNAVHGSEDHEASLREIHFFFPKLAVGPLIRNWQINEYLQGNVNSTLVIGLEELCRQRPEDPLVWLADWLLTHNPYSPKTLPVTNNTDGECTSCSSSDTTVS